MWTNRISRRLLAVAIGAVLLAACGGDGGDSPPATSTATVAAASTATPTHTPPVGEGLVSGLFVVRQDVDAASGDALGAPPSLWEGHPDSQTFDRALSHADLSLVEDRTRQANTAADGSFELSDLGPGSYNLTVTKTIEGNLVSARVPFGVGDDGSAEVVAQMSWGLVKSTSTYTKDGQTVREIYGPYGNHVILRSGVVAGLDDPNRSLVDADGDGRLDPRGCNDLVLPCDAASGCEPGATCQCVASCPLCEDCGALVCAAKGLGSPYRCGPDGTCAQAGDRCACVPSCPVCDDCRMQVCLPPCEPVEIVGLKTYGPVQLLEGQQGNVTAVAVLSDGTTMDVTYLADWESSDEAVVAVDSWGSVRAIGLGTAQVTATLGQHVSEPWPIAVVEKPPLTRIRVHNVYCDCGPVYLGGPEAPFDRRPCLMRPDVPAAGDILPVPYCNPVLRIGATVPFAAIGEFGEGLHYEDITQSAAWRVDPAAVGTIEAGLFTATAAGDAEVSASLGGVVSDGAPVRVVDHPTIVSLTIYANNVARDAVSGGPLPPDASQPGEDGTVAEPCFDCRYDLTVLNGDVLPFAATAQYDTGEWEDVTAKVAWRSNLPAVASIGTDGRMEALSAGKATIEATLDGLTSNAVGVRVVDEATLVSLSAYPEGTDRVLEKGRQMFFHATGYYDVGFGRDVTGSAVWLSSSEGVGGFDEPGVFTARAVGMTDVWAELDGQRSPSIRIEVYATSDIGYCDPDHVNRAVWSDDFNRVLLESDCAHYEPPAVVELRYTVTETQPHGGVFDPCLDLYVYAGDRRIRTIREEGCGDPFLPSGAPDRDMEATKYQLRAFWDLKDDAGRPVPPGSYEIYGRFYLYYDPVVKIAVRVGPDSGEVPTATPTRVETPVPVCTPPLCARDEVYYCPAGCPGGCGVKCATPTPERSDDRIPCRVNPCGNGCGYVPRCGESERPPLACPAVCVKLCECPAGWGLSPDGDCARCASDACCPQGAACFTDAPPCP